MGTHTENMQKIVEELKTCNKDVKDRVEEIQEDTRSFLKDFRTSFKEDFRPFIEGVKGRVEEIQGDTRNFLKDFRAAFKGVQADLRGGAKAWQNYKRGR